MKTLLKALNYALWGLALAALIAIGVCNALPAETEIPAWVSPVLCYGMLFAIDFALLVFVLRTKENNHSDASFFLKLGGVILFFVWTAVTVIDKLIG